MMGIFLAFKGVQMTPGLGNHYVIAEITLNQASYYRGFTD